MSEVLVKVCIGTTCYTEGKNNLQKLSEIIPQKYGEKVEVESCLCLGVCSTNWKKSKAPYVKIDDEIIQDATVEKVLEVLDKKLGV